ncbi:MAG: SpoIIE family protein phosphatase [candidate division Zixibacteria bacterium]|nr:SpoIIE family protein phosphatase [candidate division Zixibacteria bacterium]
MPEQSPTEVERLRAVVAELASLNEIATAISSAMSVQKITEIMIDRSLKHVRASQGAVFLLQDEQQSDLLKTFVRRSSKDDQEMPIHFNMNLTGWMVKNKRPLIVNDVVKDNPLPKVDLGKLGIKSLLAAPLLTRNGLIGVLAAFNKNGDLGFSPQDGRFMGILGTQCSQVIEGARLYEEEKRLAAIREELEIASSIQQSFLPDEESFSDDTKLFGANVPAKEVGGDFFDIVNLDENRIFLSIGDVVGKGVPAALFMSNAIAVQRAHLSNQDSLDLSALAINLNKLLCQFNKPGQFITALFGILDLKADRFDYVNAGHHPPAIVHEGQLMPHLDEADIVLGVLPDNHYEILSVAVPKNAMLCLYTDGVTEAFDEKQDEYGEERLYEFLIKTHTESARAILSQLFAELTTFRGAAQQSDDVTVVVAKT